MKNLLVLPMAVHVFYMAAFAGFMLRSRIKSIRTGEIPPKYFKTYAGDCPSERAELIGQHYENQFEVPILFLITCVLCISLDHITNTTLLLAWVFVISRGIHAWVHLGRNNVRKRAAAFFVGWFVVICLWVQLAILALT